MKQVADSTYTTDTRIWTGGRVNDGSDRVAVEAAVAMVYNGISHVVMMATPNHLEDFALGFSLSEGIIDSPEQLYSLDLVTSESGMEISMEIAAAAFARLRERRRNLVGRTGCGLCGAESLEQAIQEPARVGWDLTVRHGAIQSALATLPDCQELQAETGAVHGAAWCNTAGEIRLLREDVGRHNALDKLIGSCRKQGVDNRGFVVVTSRASYEIVAKAASMGAQVLVAVSAPTSLAIELAQKAGLTLVGFARPGRHVIYANTGRIVEE